MSQSKYISDLFECDWLTDNKTVFIFLLRQVYDILHMMVFL